MTSTERAELLTDLYALRSHCEAIHQLTAKYGMGRVAVDVSTARENITDAINTLQKNAITTEPDSRTTTTGKTL